MYAKRIGKVQRDCIAEVQAMWKTMSLARIKRVTKVATSTLHRWAVGPILPVSRKRQGFATPSIWTAERVLYNIDKNGKEE